MFKKSESEIEWLGNSAATKEEICQTEKRLNIKLPPFYRNFLLVSNGWHGVNSFIPQLFPVNEIAELRIKYPDFVAGAYFEDDPDVTDQEYLQYDVGEQFIRWRYLPSCLAVSEHEIAGTGTFLLNPNIIFENGEWEAWFYAHWAFGGRRYHSFYEMFVKETAFLD